MYEVVFENNRYEYTIKKSVFETLIFSISSKDEIETLVKMHTNKKAVHTVFSYTLLENNIVLNGCKNDGEPLKTSGDAVLRFLQERNIINILVIINRTMGGPKLGKGPLTRSYLHGIIELIKKSQLKYLENTKEVEIIFQNNKLKTIQDFIHKNNIEVIHKTITSSTCKMNIKIKEKKDIKEIEFLFDKKTVI